ncbi:MAG: rod shape-determining protein MreC [Candidatus Nealsonbacteria bacterium]|nr:rod shape-determining protein MreC [Candidatus Nealsonbacteria bacterium]
MTKSGFQFSKLPRGAKTVLLLLALATVLLAINRFGLDGGIKNVFFSVSAPLQTTLWEQGQKANFLWETVWEIDRMKGENERLERKNQELNAEIARIRNLETENEALRKALNLELEKDFQLLMADAVSQDFFSDAILINRGSINGVVVGSTVLTPEKVLVGSVQEVFPNFSRVGLLSDKKSSVSAQVQTENEEITGVARGRGNFEIVFDLVPQDKKIQVGDRLATTTLGNVFPKGLLIGEITRVDYSDVRPFQTAQVKPALNIDNLKILFVVTSLKQAR